MRVSQTQAFCILRCCRAGAATRRSTAVARSAMWCGSLEMLRDRINERAAAFLDLGQRPLQRRLHVLRIADRAFAVAAHGTRQRAEVRLRTEQVHADMRLGL